MRVIKYSGVILLVAVFTGIKLINLPSTPLFVDEANYCESGYEITQRGWKSVWSEIVTEKKFAPLLSITQGFFLTYLPNFSVITVCRGVSVMASAITNIFVFLLAKTISGDFKVSIVAVLFSLVNPFNFFNDRTSLQEPLLNTFIIGTSLWYWQGILHRKWRNILTTAVGFCLAFLTKLTAVMIIPGIILGGMIISTKNAAKNKLVYALSLTAVAMAILIWASVFTNLIDIFGYHTYATKSVTEILVRTKINLWLTINWYHQYLGIWVFIMGTLGCARAWKQKKMYVLIPVLSSLGGYILLADNYFPRLLIVTLPFIAIIVGMAVKTKIGMICFGLMLITYIHQDTKIMFTPQTAKIAREDKFQFFEDWTSGEGMDKATEVIHSANPEVIIMPKDLEASFKVHNTRYSQKPTSRLIVVTDAENTKQLLKKNDFSTGTLISTSHHGWLQSAISNQYDLVQSFQTHGENSRSLQGYTMRLRN